MIKQLIPQGIFSILFVGALVMAQGSTAQALDEIDDNENGAQKITICHRTNSIKNPYVMNSVDADSVDGDAGNDNGQGDHYLEHLGPVANPATMTNGDDWGDIIPPIEGVHDGRNWSAQGIAIYEADCNYPTQVELMPDTSVSAVCVVSEQVVRLTFVNSGNAASSISVNGAASTVAAGATVNVTTPITGATVSVTVVIDDSSEVVTVTCPTGGSGSVTTKDTPATPATPAVAVRGGAGAAEVVSLPVTSGSGAQIAAISVLFSSIVAAAGAYIMRMRNAALL